MAEVNPTVEIAARELCRHAAHVGLTQDWTSSLAVTPLEERVQQAVERRWRDYVPQAEKLLKLLSPAENVLVIAHQTLVRIRDDYKAAKWRLLPKNPVKSAEVFISEWNLQELEAAIAALENVSAENPPEGGPPLKGAQARPLEGKSKRYIDPEQVEAIASLMLMYRCGDGEDLIPPLFTTGKEARILARHILSHLAAREMGSPWAEIGGPWEGRAERC